MKGMRVFVGLVCIASLFVVMTGLALAEKTAESTAAFTRLKSSYPLVSLYEKGDYIARVFGQSFGNGDSPRETARAFKDNYAGLFDADPDDLYPVNYLPDGREIIPVMYDRETGNYKFALVYYSQIRDGIPVFRADLRLLVRNAPGYPLVLASSGLRDLGDFQVVGSAIPDPDLAERSIRSFHPGLTNIGEPKMVIWAGNDEISAKPALAMEVMADNGRPGAYDYEKWLFVIDSNSGDILYSEDMIVNVDITGNVSGMATQGWAADICDEEAPTPLPYARVYVEGEQPVFADSNGDFVLPHDGSAPVNVYSHLRGQWFRVYNQGGSDGQIVLEITPPGPVNFMHNESNIDQYRRAEVNAYLHANVIRDFALRYDPDYPVIHGQTEFAVNVNINQNCNAYYDGYSINFYTAGGGCPNTAFSTVVHHEYGHHLVNVAGSGQGAYGEGMGDVVGMLLSDNAGTAFGFSGNCNEPLRTGDNRMQYPCSGEIHYCGQLLSGSVWATRNALLANYPDDYLDIISGLAINAMTVHRGDNVDPSITVDYLTMDDDDSNIWNGTPHGLEIIEGFVFEHGMDFGVAPQINHTPLIDTEDSTSALGVTAVVYSFFSMDNGSVTVHYSTGGEYQDLELTNTSGDLWYGEIPRPDYGTTISYYIEAEDDLGIVTLAPETAPDSVYSFFYGADIIPPTFELIDSPPNTVNLFGPYGPFVITVWDIHGIDESDIVMHYRVNDENETEVNLSPSGNESEFALDQIDLGRQLNSGDAVNYYFTAYDQANTPNMGRFPETGDFQVLMADSEMFEDFEEFGIDRWYIEGSWSWREPGFEGGHSLSFGPNYPNNANDMAAMEFGFDLSPYEQARITLLHRNALLGGDTCFVLGSNDGGSSWSTVGSIAGYPGSQFFYDEYDITSLLDPSLHDYRVGFRFISDDNTTAGVLMIDNIGWAIGPVTDISEPVANLPSELSLGQNYPNPFNPQTNIYFELPSNSMVSLEVFDILGRRIATLIDGEMEAGSHSVIWDGKDKDGSPVSSGIYFYRLSTETGVRQAKMTLLK